MICFTAKLPDIEVFRNVCASPPKNPRTFIEGETLQRFAGHFRPIRLADHTLVRDREYLLHVTDVDFGLSLRCLHKQSGKASREERTKKRMQSLMHRSISE
jgi:hypothetical protein